MITAKEAAQLYALSDHEVDAFMTKTVEPEVVKAAKAGSRNVIVHLGSVQVPPYTNMTATHVHESVERKLTMLGYLAQIALYGELYVPPGLRDDDGSGPLHQNFGLHISW